MKIHPKRTVWLFDLDNTLHDASAAVFPAIARNMVDFIAQLLAQRGTPDAERLAAANALRLAYLRRYGATLKGVVLHHGVKQDAFLSEAHRFENLHSLLRRERGLARSLGRLPGRKILFTNAPVDYSRQVVKHFRLQRHFAEHISIESMQVHRNSQPKPSKAYLRKWLAQRGLRARDCVLVEDSAENLRAAREVGLRTVLVTQFGGHPGLQSARQKRVSLKADITVKSVHQLVRRCRQLSTY